MSFTANDKTKILRLKSSIASYYNLTMKKIGDRHLESLFYENCVISGGCISSLFHDEAVKDIDLYPKSSKALQLIKDYIVLSDKNIKSVDAYDIDDPSNPQPKKQFKLVTDNAVTLTNDVQFIYMDTWDNCKKKFDFLHCTPHYELLTQKLYISESQFRAIQNRQLIPTGYTEIKQRRQEKYIKRGWRLQELKPAEFRWSDSPTTIGIVAQEISQIIPGVVK
jgi:hypothetical protein